MGLGVVYAGDDDYAIKQKNLPASCGRQHALRNAFDRIAATVLCQA
ncbi:hypothetical protein EC9_18650 [Rosistilla ulvae]|uniref:Uncharacterized protein n=1 Tax=Rosistilla ulvae TaxID=1930277 RepID=A0A517LYI1_9BACT|nr:hypothetical protein EC9_18650 [Rosistilla ulvae]